MDSIKDTKMPTERPITPEEVRSLRVDYIPSIIFTKINEMIVDNFHGDSVTIKQEDILNAVCTEESGLTREKIFKKHYLDIEEFYRKQGWHVEYDKPAFCETYPATFTFSIK